MSTARVHRTDFAGGAATKVTRTPQGGLRMAAAVTRVGVLTYQGEDGRTWRELKPADEVFRPDSLATLEGAPVTELHPKEMVSADSWGDLAVGHAVGAATHDTRYVTVPVVLQRAGVCEKVDAGGLHDCSAGYTCRVDWTPGTFEGQSYDGVQRDIVYNHIALGPEGWGRAGTDVSLRMNGAATQVRANASTESDDDMSNRMNAAGATAKKTDEGDPAAQQGPSAEDRCASLEKENAALRSTLADAMKRNAEMEGAAKTVTEGDVPEAVADALTAKRIALRADAASVLGADFRFDGLNARKVHEAVVAKALPETKLDGLNDATVQGMFRAVVDVAKKNVRADSLGSLHRAAAGDPEAHHDGGDDDDADPRTALARRTHNAFDARMKTPAQQGAR